MRSISMRLAEMEKVKINIGYVGENEHTTVLIDCKKAFDEYPEAVASLTVRPPRGGEYPAVVVRNGNVVEWTVTDSDLIYAGNGEIQLTFTVGEVIVKTAIGTTVINRSLMRPGDIPTPIQNWIEQANQKIAAAEEATREAKAAAEHQPIIDDNGNWNTWDDDECAYVDTGIKAQGEDGAPGRDGQDGQDGQDGAPGQDGTDATPDLITVPYEDLTFPVAAGTQCYHDGKLYEANQAIQTSEQWTAAHWTETTVEGQLNTVKSALQVLEPAASAGDVGKFLKAKTVTDGKVTEYEFGSGGGSVSDVKVNNVSVLDGTVAKIQLASSSTPGVVKVNAGGLQMVDDTIKIAKAQDSVVKAGTVETAPIVPANQHTSSFYALAKLAGVDLANETVTLGKYPQSALIAIQKMLGVYEAPWELIREDTAINANSADIEITVDDDGQPFELTDVAIMLIVPVQTSTVIGNYGLVYFYHGSGNENIRAECGAKTISAINKENTASAIIKQNKGLYDFMYTKWVQEGNGAYLYRQQTNTTKYPLEVLTEQRVFNKVVITSIEGTIKYKLFGRKKWN